MKLPSETGSLYYMEVGPYISFVEEFRTTVLLATLIKLAAEIYRLVRMIFSQSLLSVNLWEQRDAEEST